MKSGRSAIERVMDVMRDQRCPGCGGRILAHHRTERQDRKLYHRKCLRFVRR